jgi:hypothetical protein
MGELEGTRFKVENAMRFRDLVRTAIEADAGDNVARHMMGRWCYDVANVSWATRKLGEALFGTIPSTSMEEALEHFEAAERIKPAKWLENMLWIAKCHAKMGERERARRVLEQARSVPRRTKDDEEVQESISRLMASL